MIFRTLIVLVMLLNHYVHGSNRRVTAAGPIRQVMIIETTVAKAKKASEDFKKHDDRCWMGVKLLAASSTEICCMGPQPYSLAKAGIGCVQCSMHLYKRQRALADVLKDEQTNNELKKAADLNDYRESRWILNSAPAITSAFGAPPEIMCPILVAAYISAKPKVRDAIYQVEDHVTRRIAAMLRVRT